MILISTDILHSNYLELTVPTGLPLNLQDAPVRGVDWQPATNQPAFDGASDCLGLLLKQEAKTHGTEQWWSVQTRSPPFCPCCSAELPGFLEQRKLSFPLVTTDPLLQAVRGNSVKQMGHDSYGDQSTSETSPTEELACLWGGDSLSRVFALRML